MKNPRRHLRKTSGLCVDCASPLDGSPTCRCADCRRIHNAAAREYDARTRLPHARARALDLAERIARLAKVGTAADMAPELERIAGELRALAGKERAA